MLNMLSLHPDKINFKNEIMGGIANFMAICYIIALNPLILNDGGNGFPLAPTITATVIVVIIMTALAGFVC